MERLNQVDTKMLCLGKCLLLMAENFLNMKGFYQEVEAVFTYDLGWHIGDNLDAFNDVLRGGFGRHEYGVPIHIRWISYDKSIRDLGQETMAEIEEIILDTDNSGHDCTLEKL